MKEMGTDMNQVEMGWDRKKWPCGGNGDDF